MKYCLGFLCAFFVSIIISPIVIKMCKKLKLGQNILHYVETHSDKQGTPTMGGIIFIFSVIVVGLCFVFENFLFGAICLAIFLGFGIIGFLDDFIKVKFKRNLGLRPYQKILGQTLLALVVGVYVYINPNIPNSIIIPFTNINLNLGYFIIPFVFIVFIATTNSVNLTDGLDGLASGVSFIVFLAFGFLSLLQAQTFTAGMDSEIISQLNILSILSFVVSGALLGFLIFNSFPATIFMGDTGSLALGAMLATVGVFSGLSLYIIFVGFMYVLSAVSVIIQVLYYKKTKKRVFLMAPLHHHFEKKGVNETKIVAIYIIITIVLSAVAIMLTMLGR